jgi:alpha-tubulin suppressor-like RCC1 family protein
LLRNKAGHRYQNPFFRFDKAACFSLSLKGDSTSIRFKGVNDWGQFGNHLRSQKKTTHRYHHHHPIFTLQLSTHTSFFLSSSIYVSGRNQHGILGLGHSHFTTSFQPIPFPIPIIFFSVKERNVIAMDIQSNIYTWGFMSVFDEDSSVYYSSNIPVLLTYDFEHTPQYVVAGHDCFIVLDSKHRIFTWGHKFNSFIVPISIHRPIFDIAAGSSGAIALSFHGSLFFWDSITSPPILISLSFIPVIPSYIRQYDHYIFISRGRSTRNLHVLDLNDI